MVNAIVGMETSGAIRSRLRARGVDAISVDILPSEDNSPHHIIGDVFENPVGAISSRIRKPDQIVQPWWFGDDASKKTCLWLDRMSLLMPTGYVAPRMVNGKPRWSNQTDSGQNRLSPGDDRWKDRSRTYPGLADAAAAQWSKR